ncbi:arginine-tRNA-protein transferase-like protein 1 [Mollisia scopiformis]|uniref:Arginyl-tRNA--protein transferase 1 n=1 Tax=Mollisia scopiformis TaxID=149040 RepID=A0A194XED5_MOLSC|nr:arginine-tRNA-protein transferase-like protein 1 [Mollisia scopiformis]KUJ18122.1 arginine-tRNA-protein transferas-like protein 1 [Mollisia scopiformis]
MRPLGPGSGYDNNRCGYCHSRSGSFSYYAKTTSLTPDFYQSLLNRGWRRSGSLLYKPDLRASCCPQYTLRLDSNSFHASKDQRQTLNRFTKFLLGDAYIKDAAKLYPRSREHAKKRDTEFDLVERVHEGEKEYLKSPPEPAHALVVTLEPDTYTDEKYQLFENYQRLVHHEPPSRISKSGFKSFICSSPLPRSKVMINNHERSLGSYHQCYRIDGKLIAIGVLDLLPQCVSAVYFMYHESVHQHGFGKLGGLREIAMAKEEGYKWWYAGFYIHNCVKMKYKGDYTPQHILDPESYNWNILDADVKKKLDKTKYLSLSHEDASLLPSSETEQATTSSDSPTDPMVDEDDEDEDQSVPQPDIPLFSRGMPGVMTKEQILAEVDLDHIKLRVRGTDAEACDLVGWEESELESTYSIKGSIAELAAAVGPECAREMVVSLN